VSNNPFRRFPHPDLVQGIVLSGPSNGWYRASLKSLSVAGASPAAALVGLLKSAAGDIETQYKVPTTCHKCKGTGTGHHWLNQDDEVMIDDCELCWGAGTYRPHDVDHRGNCARCGKFANEIANRPACRVQP
jgi:hypothetical protein